MPCSKFPFSSGTNEILELTRFSNKLEVCSTMPFALELFTGTTKIFARFSLAGRSILRNARPGIGINFSEMIGFLGGSGAPPGSRGFAYSLAATIFYRVVCCLWRNLNATVEQRQRKMIGVAKCRKIFNSVFASVNLSSWRNFTKTQIKHASVIGGGH